MIKEKTPALPTFTTDEDRLVFLDNEIELRQKLHEAQKIFKTVLRRVDRSRMEQSFRSASFNLGNVHLGLREPREALSHFEKLRGLEPEFLHTHLSEQFTGAALAQLGRAEVTSYKADGALDQLIAIDAAYLGVLAVANFAFPYVLPCTFFNPIQLFIPPNDPAGFPSGAPDAAPAKA